MKMLDFYSRIFPHLFSSLFLWFELQNFRKKQKNTHTISLLAVFLFSFFVPSSLCAIYNFFYLSTYKSVFLGVIRTWIYCNASKRAMVRGTHTSRGRKVCVCGREKSVECLWMRKVFCFHLQFHFIIQATFHVPFWWRGWERNSHTITYRGVIGTSPMAS